LTTIVASLQPHSARFAGQPVAPAAAAPQPVERDAAGVAGAPPPTRRLLLVDDSADNRRLVQLYLRRLPYALETAADGQAGLELFTAGAYDLVLMDVHMPVLDGLAATRAIRAWEGAQGHPPTPVIALTASVMAEDVRQALAAGCDAHLAKPLKKAALLAAIDHHTARSEEAGQAVSAA
jgi:CheY-like chemotaxis protein